MKKKIISLLLAAALVWAGTVTASAGEKYPLYTETKLEMNGSYLLLEMNESSQDGHKFWAVDDVGPKLSGDVVIPAEYDGFPIERINAGPSPFDPKGFQNADSVTALTFPGTFDCLLEEGAYFSPSIKKLTVEEGVGTFGGTYFPGVTEAHLPISMREIHFGALFWWHHDVTIYAPAYSAAQRYALDRNLNFVAEGGKTATITDAAGHWGEENILWAWHNQILMGVSETAFSPDTTMTRGMLAAALGRQLKGPDWMPSKTDGPLPFKDVKEENYYYAGCYYLRQIKAMLGKAEDAFCPNDNVTRQELAATLFRATPDAAQYSEEGLQSFKDAGAVSSWARQAMSWAVEAGILKGDNENRLNPKGDATRAEVATMLYRYQRYLELEELKETQYPPYPGS